MAKQILAMALAALLGGDCLGRTPPSNRLTPKEYVHTMANGSPVEVRFANGARLRGRIIEVSDEGFVLSYEEMMDLQTRQITFDQVKAVKQVSNVKTSHAARNILIGVGIGVSVVAIGAIVAIALAAGGGLKLVGNGGW